ncbi:MAG: HPr kinase/phosphatase C-terminal domain-containing protein [Methylocapsa sp.]|nr:HPr kinase/phosphatase C-terminal domain-containing protein [Methylocapsa sp.]
MPRSADTPYLHATAAVIGEAGVLILGPSGSGKSTLAFNLIACAEQAGYFARLVGDDRVSLDLRGSRLIATGHPAIRGKLERRGLGILEMPFVTSCVLRLVLRLSNPDEMPPRYPSPDEKTILLEGARLPLLPVCWSFASASCALALLAELRLQRLIP